MTNKKSRVWKKVAAALLLAASCGWLQDAAHAANPAKLNINVSVTAQLSVSVNGVANSTYTGVSWNTANPNDQLVAASSTTVINDSNVVEKWELNTSTVSSNVSGNPESWTLATTTAPALPSTDQYALQAVFGSSNTIAGGCPGVGAATWQDGSIAPPITTTGQRYTATRFAATALQNAGGLHTPDVSASGNMFAGGQRVLCWRIIAPAATTTTDSQNIQLVVTAVP